MQAIKNYRACLWLSGCLILRSFCCFAHDEPVHEKLSESAAKLSSGLTGFLTDQFGNSDAPFVENPRLYFWPADIEPAVGVAGPIGWIKVGSRTEDAPYRYKNHFHDPTKNPPIGLTDGWIFGAFPSFEWASVPGIGDLLNVNNDTWPNARNLEWEALTTSNKGSREASLGHMFYALGRIIHLNQDLSQPDHVRNDNHMQIGGGIRPFGPHWIENHGKWNYMRHPEWFVLDPAKHIQGWSAWRQGGFTKLEAFWDRNKYTGTDEQLIAALDHDVDSDKKLGLAEFCNGNFLGEDATYAEYFTPGDQHYFPFPRVRRMQSFKDYQGNLPANVRMTFVRNGDSVYPSACEGAVWVYFYTPGICNAGPPLDAAVTVQVSGVLGQDTRCGYNSKARAEIEVNFKNNTGFASWKLNGYDGMSPVSYEHTVTATGRIGTGQSWAPTIQLWCDYSTMNATITIRPLTIP